MLKKRMLLIFMCVALVITMCSCGKKNETASGSETVLTWYLRGSEPQNAEAVFAKANEYTKEKIGVTVDYKFVEPAGYEQKMNLLMSSGEEFDICWTSDWCNNYSGNAKSGAFVALDDYLDEYSDLKNSMPENVWELSKVDGKIYGIFCNQVWALPDGWWFNKEIADKHNIDLSKVDDMGDLTEIFEIIKEREPNMVPAHYGDALLAHNSMMERGEIIENFYVDPVTYEVKDYCRVSDEMMPYYELMREWYNKGFFPANIATASDADITLAKTGKLFSGYSGCKPGGETELKELYGFDVEVVELASPKKLVSLQSTMNAISSTSKNVEKSLEFLQLVNTDKTLYNLLIFGIEGEDYKKIDENTIEKIDGGYQTDAWMIGNQFNAYVTKGQEPDVWEQTIAINNAAEVSEFAGFQFDNSAVKVMMAQVSAVASEYDPILKNGLADPEEKIKEYKHKLKQAGIDDIKSELQRQLNAWKNK